MLCKIRQDLPPLSCQSSANSSFIIPPFPNHWSALYLCYHLTWVLQQCICRLSLIRWLLPSNWLKLVSIKKKTNFPSRSQVQFLWKPISQVLFQIFWQHWSMNGGLLIGGIIEWNKRSRRLKSPLGVCVLACYALNSSFRLNKELFKFFW